MSRYYVGTQEVSVDNISVELNHLTKTLAGYGMP